MKNINLKTNDFKEIIESNSLFIDKTLFIKELIDNPSPAICFPRPSKFGKSLNMSMLNYYFNLEYKDNNLFNGLEIMKQGEEYSKEMNKYPVISLSFKELKTNTYQEFIIKFKLLMKNLYEKYSMLLDSNEIVEIDKKFIKKIINMNEDVFLDDSLAELIRMLNRHYGVEVIVLLEDYDVPIINGYFNGYYDEVVDFINQVLVTVFKDNNELKKGIITCISKINTETLFSCANNLNVYDTTDRKFSTYFGFTESEVKWVLKEYNLSDTFDDVKKWYGGYLFGENTIYNPYSILKYLENKEHKLIPYWTNKEGVGLLKNLIYNLNGKLEILKSFENLITTNIIKNISLDFNLKLNILEGDKSTIYTLFMLSGYLTPIEYLETLKNVTLRIPNLEIKENLENIVIDWFKSGPLRNYDFTRFLISHDLENFENSFKNIVEESFSYYNILNNRDGEKFYCAFTLGLLYLSQSDYEITSNRELGYERYNLILKPINSKYAYIIEFKLLRYNDFDKTIEEGFKEIEEMKYDLSCYDVTKMVIAFYGKRVKIETR